MTVNVGEYGLALNLNVNFDISGATSLQVSVTRPDNSAFSGTPVRGVVDLVVPAPFSTFKANQYATYLIQAGDLTLAGEYTVRLTYKDANKLLVSDRTSFMVYS